MSPFTITLHGPGTWGSGAKDGEGEGEGEGTQRPVPLCVTYLGMATAFAEGANSLHRADGINPLATALLLSQSMENALKAWLTRDGVRPELYKAKIRHDLEGLWSLAYAERLPVSGECPTWMRHLAKSHRNPYLNRYSENQLMVVHPDLGKHCEGATELISVVKTALESRTPPDKR